MQDFLGMGSNLIISLTGGFIVVWLFKLGSEFLMSSKRPWVFKTVSAFAIGGLMIGSTAGSLLSFAHQSYAEATKFHYPIIA